MTALAAEKARRSETWRFKAFTLASGSVGYKGARACLNAAGKVVPASAATGLLAIGVFAETVDASSSDLPITVDLEREIQVERFANDGASAVASTDLGEVCYMKDDATVSMASAGRSVAGRVWDVSATLGVAVQKLENYPAYALAELSAGTLPGQVANDFILPAANISQDAVFEIGTTAGASTVTLPDDAEEGARITFIADGTANGHTVQYRDATGPTNITTALTASKRHLVMCVFQGGAWYANAYVSP